MDDIQLVFGYVSLGQTLWLLRKPLRMCSRLSLSSSFTGARMSLLTTYTAAGIFKTAARHLRLLERWKNSADTASAYV